MKGSSHHRSRKFLLAWVLIGAAALLIAFAPFPNLHRSPSDRFFRVEAGNFAYTPANLMVNPGDRVTIELVSTDVVHGMYIDGYDLDVQADPGQPQRLTFIADRAGMFRFRCSVTCGALHPFMIGKLHVGQNTLLWRGMGLAVLLGFAGIWMVRQDRNTINP
ncbi:MAG TPA: hypothetical protein VI776_10750 [Anaerolineales bacterium]|nr:hypothetical protein [Anaerolineales bacterium]